ncbi:far upstream element-binding protein 1-like isoform X40 [Branchiostoma floridae x Branchiostoma belcheri]
MSMMDYSAVAPPSAMSTPETQNAAFADALQRARQIAAKIGGDGAVPETDSRKRGLEDGPGELNGTPDNMFRDYGAIGAQLAQQLAQQRNFSSSRAGGVVTEEYRVPDKMVGLIIGRGGEQITRLQAESGCKVQMAQDSGGLPERVCTLTGTPPSIEHAKRLIDGIIEKGRSSGATEQPGTTLPDGSIVTEMMIPGNKVGLVIGKGGETIRSLQERAGVKMVMIQDGPYMNAPEKPLRITGDPQKTQRAKDLVMDLITDKELEGEFFGGPQGMRRGGRDFDTNDYGSARGGGGGGMDIPVPRFAVGIVIGKGGEMIKKIQNETGVRVQFKPDDGQNPNRVCQLMGAPDRCQAAAHTIQNLVEDAQADFGFGGGRGFNPWNQRDQAGGGPGMGRGRGRGDWGRGPGGPGPMRTDEFPVPNNKCGLVIGKGGESIRTINQQSGAHVELMRNPPPHCEPGMKMFSIRGSPQQIDHAKQLIHEKISGGPPGPPGGPGGPGGFNQGPPPPNQPPPPGGGPPPYAPQGWGNAYQQQWQQGQGGPNDPNKAAQDNAAAWQAYYAQYYNWQQQAQPPAPGQGPPQQADQQQQQPQQQQPQQPGGQQGAPAQQQTQQTGQQAQSGQPDYTKAWEEYYKRQAQQQQQQPAAQPQQDYSQAWADYYRQYGGAPGQSQPGQQGQ